MTHEVDGTRLSLRRLTAEWFLFLTTYRRNVHAMPPETDWVRGELVKMLNRMEQAAGTDPRVEFQFQQVRHALVYFADEVLLNCRWSGEAAWSRDLLERQIFGTHHAGQDFFDRLHDPQLRDEEVIEIYYKCLCLGFAGNLVRKPLRLREEREAAAARLRSERIAWPRFCPDAYAHTERRDFVKLPVVATTRIAAACLLFLFLTYTLAGWYAGGWVEELRRSAEVILGQLDTH